MPNVAYVERDADVSLFAQDIPTGIDRTFATANAGIGIDDIDNERVDVDVAVIDTGVDREHPDLNVVDGVDCASMRGCRGNGDDDHYHGTHVAGTIGAIDHNDGVVGIAPGARIHAVKVLNRRGSGRTSWIIAGIDWVAANSNTIEVANMSLGGRGYSQAEYDAIQGAVNLGVAFAVAAGNDADLASRYSPAAFDNVLTVSALADFNGLPGGGASSTCRNDQDDTLADVANLYSRLQDDGNSNWTDDSGDGVKEPLLDVSGYAPVLR
ncbi:MAG: S8 family serine peptidase [Acidimicrobiia bacterium]|nr:S8 family serine peptidase [Acidimicrobiia bacterium]